MKMLYCLVVFLILFDIFLTWRRFQRNNQKSVVSDRESIPPRVVPCPRDLLVGDSLTVIMTLDDYRALPFVAEVDSSILKIGDRIRLGQDRFGWHLIGTFESRGDDGTPIFTSSRVCFGRSSDA